MVLNIFQQFMSRRWVLGKVIERKDWRERLSGEFLRTRWLEEDLELEAVWGSHCYPPCFHSIAFHPTHNAPASNSASIRPVSQSSPWKWEDAARGQGRLTLLGSDVSHGVL